MTPRGRSASGDLKPPGDLTEELELRTIAGPPRYTSRTDKPVDYLPIAKLDDGARAESLATLHGLAALP